ncbi:MAG: hypothetical protein WD830_03830 [Chloroflexota bacterium]
MTNSLTALTTSGGRYEAIGQNVALTSTDGQTWTSATTEFSSGSVNSQLFPLPNGFLVTGVRNDGATAMECNSGGVPRPSIQVLPTGEPDTSPGQPETPDLGVPSETCSPVPGSGGTWVSRDGSEWKRGADLPQDARSAGGTTYVLAAGHDALVASYDAIIAGEASRRGMLWYEPLSDFRP